MRSVCERPISDFATINESTYRGEGTVKYLDTGNITSGIINEIQTYGCLSDAPSRARRKVLCGDIVYSTVRPNQKHYGYICKETEELVVSTGFAVISVHDETVNPKYVYYYLSQDNITDYLQSIAEQSTSAYPSITSDDIGELAIPLPDRATQDKIVNILDSISDLMSLNRLINDYLVKIGKAVFEKLQDNASIHCTISDVAKEIICGKTPSTSVEEYYGNEIPFITIPDMHNSIAIVTTERMLSSHGAISQNRKMLPRHSICVSCIATPGLVSVTTTPSQTNQQINSIICNDNISPFYMYYLMESLSDTIINLGSGGSATLNLSKAQFSQIEIDIVPNDKMTCFEKNMNPILEMIESNLRVNSQLSKLRDFLLPKLMSGEIDISNLI
jgi:type I restriction enzyme S subunit